MTRPCTVLWTSEPLAIGKHEWRIVVGDFPHLVTVDRALGRDDTNGRATFYEWRPLACHGVPHDWRDEREWPTYDGDRSDCGTPRTLRKRLCCKRRLSETEGLWTRGGGMSVR